MKSALKDSGSNTGTRRAFVKKTATSTVLASALGTTPFAILNPQAARSDGNKLGIALVGMGHLATHQIAPALAKTKHVRLAGVVSGTPSKIESWRNQYGIPAKNCYSYETYDRIADNPEIDIIYIVLPNSMHAEYTIRAARSGKHVLCEKPMANSAKDCEEMITACRQAKRRLAIGYRCQFEPHHLRCLQFARERTFGDLKMIEAGFGFRIGDPNQWRLKHRYAGGGALMDVGIYALQACRYLSGEEPTHIAAMETKTDPVKFSEVDESITWTMTFPSGLNCYCSTTYALSGINRLNAHGDQGWFRLNPAFSYSGITGTTSNAGPIHYSPIDQFAAELDDFAICVREDRESKVSGLEGLKDLRAIEAIYQSIRTGRTVQVAETISDTTL